MGNVDLITCGKREGRGGVCRDGRGLIRDFYGGRCNFRTKAPAGQLNTALGDRYLRGTRAAIDIELRAEVFQEHVIRNDTKWPGRIVAKILGEAQSDPSIG